MTNRDDDERKDLGGILDSLRQQVGQEESDGNPAGKMLDALNQISESVADRDIIEQRFRVQTRRRVIKTENRKAADNLL